MEKTCKTCGTKTTNGTNFCTRKHRLEWVRKHNRTKKDWQKIQIKYEAELRSYSTKTDMYGNSWPHN